MPWSEELSEGNYGRLCHLREILKLKSVVYERLRLRRVVPTSWTAVQTIETCVLNIAIGNRCNPAKASLKYFEDHFEDIIIDRTEKKAEDEVVNERARLPCYCSVMRLGFAELWPLTGVLS